MDFKRLFIIRYMRMRIISTFGYPIRHLENFCAFNAFLAKLLAEILLPNNTVIVTFPRNFYLMAFLKMGL